VVSNSQSLAGRYAAALYELAEQEKSLDNVAGDLTDFGQLMTDSKDLWRLIKSPVISREDQKSSLMIILEKANANELTKKFIGAVIMNRRIFFIEEIIDAFKSELADRRGEVKASITSAVTLDTKQVDMVAKALNKTLGQKVSVDVTVDDSLIGGLIVRVGSRMIDSSIRTKLQRLQFAMKGVD